MSEVEARLQRLGRPGDQLLEGLLGPGDLPLGRPAERLPAFFPDASDFFVACFFSTMCSGAWRRRSPACRSPAVRRARRSAGTRARRGARPSSRRTSRASEQDRPDRDVHADAERVGAADDLEEPLLRELLDEQPVAREEPGVVDADAEREDAPQLLAVGGVEAPSRTPRRSPRAAPCVPIFTLVSACASSAHSRCVKFTT